jgi:hypothetical protein
MADNTASLVVALSAQLTKFEKDMRDAGIMAEKATKDIEGKFSKMNPQVSTSFLGNLFSNLATKGLSAAEEAIKDIIKRFEELQQTAKYTETSLQWVYGLQEAFKKSGSSADDLNKALTTVALQLDQIKRGNTENPLAKLFAANGINPNTINSAADALARVGDVVQTLKPIERIEVARALGLPESSVSALERGGAAIKQMAEEAAKAGANIEELAIKAKALSSVFETMWKSFKDMMSSAAFDMIKTDLQDLIQFFETLQGLFKGGPLAGWVDRTTASLQEMGAEMQDAAEEAERAKKRIYVGVAAPKYTGVDPFGLNAPKADTKDAYDREVASINKHIAAMQADAATVGETAGAQEEYRVQMLLSEKAAEANKDMTLELNDAIAAQAGRAAQARQALAENTFQLQKMNAASQTVGQALSSSFTDAIVEGKKLNEVFADLIKTLEKAALNSLIMSFFTPGAGQSQSWFSSILPKFAEGTSSAPGGMAVVGEKGPELVNLPRGSQVIPNSVARGMGAGGSIVYSPAIDARGASVDAVARLAQILAEDRASFASRTVHTIQQARRGRVPGL